MQFQRTKKFLAILTLSCLLTGCSDTAAPAPTAQPTAVTPTPNPVVAENPKYNLSLPNAQTFGEIFKDYIYWDYATCISKDSYSIINILKDENCLEKELKMQFYYRECDKDEMDNGIRNIYNIIVTFPEQETLSFFSLDYNANGLSSAYDYDYGGWLDAIQQMSSQELMEQKEFKEQYTLFGETALTIKGSEADAYEPTDKFETGKKEKILKAIEKSIRKEYKKEKDLYVFVWDFLPGDTYLSGEIVDLNMTKENTMPLYWIQSAIYYSDKKMEKFDDIYWDIRYSTAYSGASQPNYNPTVKQLKKWAKEERDSVDIDKCILAYHIKDGEFINLK